MIHEQEKLIYKMIDRCNDYQKLCKIQKEISTLVKITRDKSLLKNLSDVKHEKTNTHTNDVTNHSTKKLDQQLDNPHHEDDINKIKNNIKLQLNMLKSMIAHRMDPVQRAGETVKSNNKDAKKFGRSTKENKSSNMLTALLKMIVNQITLILSIAVTHDTTEHKKNTEPEYRPQYLSNMLSNNSQKTRSR
ncbi:Hypothetical protein ERGA_CDS_03980 [Ehrlichia ruminantium str. Gardel]|uniref:hypothetical protein n=1 Tax=Ehrlichia ruminantium TaxID=779 RepID=UPI00004C77D4|nr:hypothetical protein [Ehrlichia ruminantium]CAI27850.1 Hypothetical protein ERGA_CDS_03980 [Ehrlichia ruminantium str. Gardel]